MLPRLIILANRLPIRKGSDGVNWERAPGGLISAMEPVLTTRQGLWIGWQGEPGRGSRPFAVGDLKVDSAVFVQVAVPSRESVREYADLRAHIERTVGRINGEHSQPGKVAVHYFRRNLSREDLVAYYLAADVMVVTPASDGMNLVAKEFVAARIDSGGMLVLSEFAGAARELRRAILVNPFDIDAQASAIMQALRIPRADARFRMNIMRTQVRRHDVHDWAKSFLEALE